MITFTTFKALIFSSYIWFALGAVLISVFAVKELWTMLTSGSKRHKKDNI